MKTCIQKNNISKFTLGGMLVTLGVVYGDIGTSPLYVMKCVIKNNGEGGEIKLQSRRYTTMPYRKVGDFRFILIQEQLSHESELTFGESLILRAKLFIKKFTVSPSKWFGLDTSDVYIEKVPLFIGHPNPTTLKRTSE